MLPSAFSSFHFHRCVWPGIPIVLSFAKCSRCTKGPWHLPGIITRTSQAAADIVAFADALSFLQEAAPPPPLKLSFLHLLTFFFMLLLARASQSQFHRSQGLYFNVPRIQAGVYQPSGCTPVIKFSSQAKRLIPLDLELCLRRRMLWTGSIPVN